jgi:hypothetical protein
MKRIARCGVLLTLCLGPLPAFADTIGIHESHLEMNPSIGPLVLAGDRGFTFQSVVAFFSGRFLPHDCNLDPLRCVPGATLSLLATWSGADLPGTATLDGVTYRVDGLTGPNSMSVLFDGHAVLPELAATAIVTAPFVFEGTFRHSSPSVPQVSDQLIGQGTATLSLRQNPAFPNSWALSNARYDFDPVPEPSTVLLLAGGAAALLARRRRRKLL